jgi:CheY-like chemotaxis protein
LPPPIPMNDPNDTLTMLPRAASAATAQSMLKRVLLIDDDPIVRTVVAGQLRTLGYAQVSTSSGDAETMRLLVECGPYDVIITDISMPTFDGMQLTRVIAQYHPASRLVYISAGGEQVLDEARQLADRQGLAVLGCVAKPVRRAVLQRLLESGR